MKQWSVISKQLSVFFAFVVSLGGAGAVWGQCKDLAEGMPCYRQPASVSNTIWRRLLGFVEGIDAAELGKRGGLTFGAAERGLPHRFSTGLCGRSAAFPPYLRCGADKKRLPQRSGAILIMRGKRGEMLITEKLAVSFSVDEILAELDDKPANLAEIPDIAPLVPEHLALSLSAQPTLYWYFSKPWAGEVQFTLKRTDSDKPALQRTLSAPQGFSKGIQQLALHEYDVELLPGIDYEWFVSLRLPSDEQLFASGALRHVETMDGVTPGEQETDVLAAAGLWHDALHAVQQRIRENSHNPDYQVQRKVLLQQADLPRAVVEGV